MPSFSPSGLWVVIPRLSNKKLAGKEHINNNKIYAGILFICGT
tara:strand:+ start:295 stop:423 length:129 start_codon:yes stop_codon:yes gene_type:complete